MRTPLEASFDPDVHQAGDQHSDEKLDLERISEELAATYFDKAIQYLHRVNADPDRKTSLEILAQGLMSRQQ